MLLKILEFEERVVGEAEETQRVDGVEEQRGDYIGTSQP